MTVIIMDKMKEMKPAEIELDIEDIKRQLKEASEAKTLDEELDQIEMTEEQVRDKCRWLVDHIVTMLIIVITIFGFLDFWDFTARDTKITNCLLDTYFILCKPFMVFTSADFPFAARVAVCFLKMWYISSKMRSFMMSPKLKTKIKCVVVLPFTLWLVPFFMEYYGAGRMDIAFGGTLMALLSIIILTFLIEFKWIIGLMFCAYPFASLLPLRLYLELLTMSWVCIAIKSRFEGDKASKIFLALLIGIDIINKVIRGVIQHNISSFDGVYVDIFDKLYPFVTVMVFAHAYLAIHQKHPDKDLPTILGFYLYYTQATNYLLKI